MVFWALAIGLTLVACAALFYAGRLQAVNANPDNAASALDAHHRAQLEEIEGDVARGELSIEDGETARAELARELLRQSGEQTSGLARARPPRFLVPMSVLVIAVVAFGIYWQLGSPQLPGQPLSARQAEIADRMSLAQAIAKVEQRLKETPDDLRGWQVIAPIYMQQQRFDDAVHAYRRILDLQPPTADAETDLAEALTMANGGTPNAEAMALLNSAVARDPGNVRARFYLADTATRQGRFDEAKRLWNDVLALSRGGESWLPAAQAGLEAAQNGQTGATPAAGNGLSLDPEQRQMVQGMVEGLASRLESDGGSIDEWTRLVRSRLVLGDKAAAQKAYDEAVAAYPDATARTALDNMAKQAGLQVK
ncbi:MAG TPA: c-type cytochrome biogenesis protein CcmI [Devosiaceae bacterium]